MLHRQIEIISLYCSFEGLILWRYSCVVYDFCFLISRYPLFLFWISATVYAVDYATTGRQKQSLCFNYLLLIFGHISKMLLCASWKTGPKRKAICFGLAFDLNTRPLVLCTSTFFCLNYPGLGWWHLQIVNESLLRNNTVDEASSDNSTTWPQHPGGQWLACLCFPIIALLC
jgi:hypothetical protein